MNIAVAIARAARRFPERPALICEDRTITYADLEQQIRRYQTFFEARVVAAGRLVAVLAFKSIDAVAFTQAALRHGLAYTVIDPRYPSERIRLILRDAEPAVVFTDLEGDPLDAACTDVPPASLVVERAQAAWRGATPVAAIHALAPSASELASGPPGRLAYVLYTSGSTGVPKGVRISHENVQFSIDWAQDALAFDETDVLLNQAHFGFDFCVIDHYNAWNAGACVVMVPEYHAVFPAHVVELIRSAKVTSLWLVPSNVIALINQGGLFDVDSSRICRFLYGGEPFPMPYLRRVFAWMEGRDVFNLYGPTETNLITSHRVQAADLERDEVPLGRALPGTQIRLGRDGGLYERGKGEIWAHAPSVALGYTNRPDLDASRFVTRDGRLWYRTGDLAFIDDDGAIWYRGRIDGMVKVRGYRIELQEIETALAGMPGVSESVVVVGQHDGEKSIHAFCVADPTVSRTAISAHVAARLPAFMVPQHFHFVERIPQNDRGKADRLALAQAAHT